MCASVLSAQRLFKETILVICSAEEHCTNTTAARAEFVHRKLHISCCASELYKENYIVVLCQAFFFLALFEAGSLMMPC